MTGNAAHLVINHDAAGSAAARPPERHPVLDRLKRHTGTVSIARDSAWEERRSPIRHPVRDTWITVASALVIVSALSVQDWQADRHEPYYQQLLVMDAVIGLVLTPLLVATFLSLRSCTAWLLWQLDRNKVIDPALDGTGLDRFAWKLDRRLDRLTRPTAIATTLYLAYTLVDGLDDLDGPVAALLFATTLAAQATLFFLGVLTARSRICWPSSTPSCFPPPWSTCCGGHTGSWSSGGSGSSPRSPGRSTTPSAPPGP